MNQYEIKEVNIDTAPRKFVCIVCGFVYAGDEVPCNYKCPICNSSKSFFKLVK